ncbi:MAG TPA: fructosamine kinase family protein [Candidatus Choladousia intestinigallinarum]|nr:fructosamine kinase family protein [Candidatus Choladousia intestinigallinarum]
MERNPVKDGFSSLSQMAEELFGKGVRIVSREPLHGGDINDAYRVKLSAGEDIFVKVNSLGRADFFRKEAAGLAALGSSEEIGVPRLLGFGTDRQEGIAFLALEYIKSAPAIPAYWETFGHELARLHKAKCQSFVGSEGKYGFTENNYIGASPQKNTPREKWTDFFRECRLLPQLTMAESYLGASLRKKADRLLERLDLYLREPEFPSLLHGDLWGGNVLCGGDGRAWIIDPAAYVGDFEADLAMTQLFGSLPERFYQAYHEINPMEKEGYLQRRELYNLYHLLNHLNLFGRMYLGSAAEIINKYGS